MHFSVDDDLLKHRSGPESRDCYADYCITQTMSATTSGHNLYEKSETTSYC